MTEPTAGNTEGEGVARQRLLAAALELFTRKGYAATTVREIVAAAGVSKPVLYYYFTNKEGIYLELMSGTFALFEGILSGLRQSHGSARERILRFATMIFDGFVANIQVMRLIYAIFFGPPQGAPHFPHEQYFTAMLEVVAGLVAEGVATDEFREVDAQQVAWIVVSCMNTAMEEQLCHCPPRVDGERLTAMLDLVLDGIPYQGGRR
jgi:AcrR family transcriptional regulator